jgi:hypothetical protein
MNENDCVVLVCVLLGCITYNTETFVCFIKN